CQSGHFGCDAFALFLHAKQLRYDVSQGFGSIVFDKEGPIGVMVQEKNAGATTEPTLADLREALIAASETDYGIHRV
ncbi:hypothetical protein ACC687_42810, partial [Rhizobium ruizarguesonis]